MAARLSAQRTIVDTTDVRCALVDAFGVGAAGTRGQRRLLERAFFYRRLREVPIPTVSPGRTAPDHILDQDVGRTTAHHQPVLGEVLELSSLDLDVVNVSQPTDGIHVTEVAVDDGDSCAVTDHQSVVISDP